MTPEETLKKVLENPFRLILVAGERVEQLRKGAKPRAKAPINKPTFIALEELKQGKFEIRFIEKEQSEEEFSTENLDSLVEDMEISQG